MIIKKFSFGFACIYCVIFCCAVKAEVNVSGSLNEARRRLDVGEAFMFQCTDDMHEGKCADAEFDNGEDKILFFKAYNNRWGHSIYTCQSGYHCVANSCVSGAGNTTCNDANIVSRCGGLSGREYNECMSCSTLSNWDLWDHVDKVCNDTSVNLSDATDVTVTVTDTNGNPLVGVRVQYDDDKIDVTNNDGKVTFSASTGVGIEVTYGCRSKYLEIESANTTVKLDVHWFNGMEPGQIREIDCMNSENSFVCMQNVKYGIIGLNYDSKPRCDIILECNAGQEWYKSGDVISCREGSGPSRVTDFSEIALERCEGLSGELKASCIECTKRDWNAWDWKNKVCNINFSSGTGNSSSVNVSDVTKNIEKIANDLKAISEKFGQSHWKTASGNFNGARLASDSVAGVVLGTAGGLITSHVIKNNQINGGFQDIQCVINGQVVSGYADDFVVGIR